MGNLLSFSDLRTTLVLDDEVVGISADHTTEIRAKFSVLKDLIAEDNLAAIQANEAAISANASNIASLSVFADVTSVVSGDYVTGYNAAGDTLQRITAAKLSTSLAALIESGGVVSIGGTQVLAQAGGIATVGVSANTRTQLYGNVHTSTGNTGSNCNFIGDSAGLNNSGNDCVAIGHQALRLNTRDFNAAMGYQALYHNTGERNVASGFQALYLNSGDNNVGSGMYALSSNTGANNTASGRSALQSNTGNSNTASGYFAMQSNTGNSNTASGYQALRSNTGNNNTASGVNALQSNTGANNTASGYHSGTYQTGGTVALTTASNSLFLGATTKGVQGATNQIVIGDTAESLGANTVVLGNPSITLTQLRGNVQTSTGNTGLDCNFVGSGAGLNNSGNNCVGLGYETLNSGNSGYENIAIGSKALYSNSTGEYNVAIGYQTLYNNSSGFYNVSNGFLALNKNTTGGYNVAIGYSALYHNTTGNNNIAIGYNAGREQSTFAALTTASSSVFLGATTKGVQGAINQIVIGDNAESIGANTVVLGNANIVTTALRGNVGIGTNTPNANAILDVSSTTKAFLPPRMTTSQKNAVASPTAGMVVYDSTLDKLSLRDGTEWKTLALDFDAPVLSGAEPAQVDIMSGTSVVVNTSGWFSGTVTHYVMSVPSGMNFDFFTGAITGQIPDGVVPDLIVRAYNGESYVEHTAPWNKFWSLEQAQAEAKGWYDTEPTSLKTDLVASFVAANSERLHLTAINQNFDLSGDFTWQLWLNHEETGALQWPLDLGAGSLADTGISFRLNAPNNMRFSVANGTTLQSVNQNLTPLVWNHLVMTRSGTDITCFVNGVQTGATFTQASDLTNADKFSLGVFATDSWPLQGKEAHVAFWTRHITPAEVTTLYNGGVLQPIPSSLKIGGVSYWPLNEPRGVRYDRWGTNHLDDINTVGTAHGPVEYQADNYAGITRWDNQGTAASPYSAATSPDLPTVPQLVNGRVVLGGDDFLDVTATLSAGTMIASTELGSLAMEYSGAAGATEMGSMGVFETFHTDAENPVYGIAVFGRTLTELEIAAVISEFGGTPTFAAATALPATWRGGSNITSFPLMDTSSVTSLYLAWRGCSGITLFPLINTSNVWNFFGAWRGCSGIISFPPLNFNAATNLSTTWSDCSSLTSFPVNAFDSSPCTNYTNAFAGCALDQTSVDNILVSINTAGTSGGTLDIDGGTNAVPSVTGFAAKSALEGRGWTVTVNLGIAALKADAKGWYDTEPTSLKTDLVAKFVATNGEVLSIADGEGTDLDVTTSYSVALWVKRSSLINSRANLFSHYGASGSRSWMLMYNSGNLRLRQSIAGSDETGYNATTAIPLDTWVHVGFTYDSATQALQFYRNGSTDGSHSSVAPPFDIGAGQPVRIGGRTDDPLGNFDGNLSHIALWNTVLDPADFVTLYNGGTQQPIPSSLETDGVSYWPLNESRGMRYDRWGTNHLSDNNTVGTAHGPVEYQADEHAGVTKWENQGLAASPFGDLTAYETDLSLAPVVGSDGCLRFGLSGLETLIGATIQPFTVYIRLTLNTLTNGGPYSWLFDQYDAPNRINARTEASEIEQFAGTINRAAVVPDIAVPVSMIFKYNGASSVITVGGVDYVGDAGTLGLSQGVVVGGGYTQNTATLDADMSAFLIKDGVFSATEIAALDTFFA